LLEFKFQATVSLGPYIGKQVYDSFQEKRSFLIFFSQQISNKCLKGSLKNYVLFFFIYLRLFLYNKLKAMGVTKTTTAGNLMSNK